MLRRGGAVSLAKPQLPDVRRLARQHDARQTQTHPARPALTCSEEPACTGVSCGANQRGGLGVLLPLLRNHLCAAHHSTPYLSANFFERMVATWVTQWYCSSANAMGCQSVRHCIASGDTVYGRYWGTLEALRSLHFEACYYQPIEWCIANGFQRFRWRPGRTTNSPAGCRQ